MNKVIIDFGNIVEEMKRKQINLCLLRNKTWIIIDSQNRFYQMESYYNGGFLDKYIINKIKIEFNLIHKSVNDSVKMYEMEIWDDKKVEDFIKRQSKYWI